MRSMKTLLRLLGAVSLTTVAASSVVACGTQTKAPTLDGKYAALLGWYSDENKSLINQKLKKDESTAGQEKYSIIADNSLIWTAEFFKTKLLTTKEVTEPQKYRAKDADAAAFLKDLGFNSGNESKDYSTNEITKITALSAKVTSSTPGKIEENGTNDFKVSDGTCQVDIMDKAGEGAKVVKSYTIKTLKNDTLEVPTAVSSIVVTTENLDFTKEKGYVQGGKVLTSLPWKTNKSVEKNQYNSLVKLFGKESLNWTSDNAGKTPIITYPTSGSAYLTIKFGNIKVLTNLNCGNLPNA